MVQEDPRIVAVGGQVAIANGCTIRHSARVVNVGLPSHPLGPVSDGRVPPVLHHRPDRTRTGSDSIPDSLRASSRSSRRKRVIRAGGYLTPLVRHQLVEEYVGGRAPAPSARTWRSWSGCIASVPGQAAGPADRLSAPPGGLDRGAGAARFASEAARDAGIAACASRFFYHREMLFNRKFGPDRMVLRCPPSGSSSTTAR